MDIIQDMIEMATAIKDKNKVYFKGMGYVDDDGKGGYAVYEHHAALSAKTAFDKMPSEEQSKSYIEFSGGEFGEYHEWEIKRYES